MQLTAKSPVGAEFLAGIGNPQIGTDPETFAMVGAKLLPAFEFLPHKREPIKVSEGWGEISAYWDGFQAEFRMDRGYNCAMEMCAATQTGLKTIYNAAIAKDSSAKLSLKSVVRIPKAIMEATFDPYVELGCEPSLNAYDLRGSLIPNPRKLRYRFAGGHMHFGIANRITKAQKPIQAVKMLDKILGLWSVGAAQSFDNPIRRRYYGIAGEHRLPAHGVEYRVLSNFWLSHPVIYQAVWEIGRKAVAFAYSEHNELWVAPEEMVIEAIQNSDVKLAAKLLKLNKPIFLWLFGMKGWDALTVEKLFQVGLDGIESIIKNPEAITDNWLITGKEITKVNPYGEWDERWTWQGFARGTGKP